MDLCNKRCFLLLFLVDTHFMPGLLFFVFANSIYGLFLYIGDGGLSISGVLKRMRELFKNCLHPFIGLICIYDSAKGQSYTSSESASVLSLSVRLMYTAEE